MIGDCGVPVNAGVIRGVVGAVDCRTRDLAELGYRSLTGSDSIFPAALTLALTIYVALLGYRMLFARGGARLADLPVVGLKIGAVLALVGGWSTFQTLVFDVAAKAPVEIAAIISRPLTAQGSSLVRDPVGGLQAAYDQIADSAGAFGALAGPAARAYKTSQAAAAEALTAASGALFITTAGVISVATMAIGILTAVGPIFVALFLFDHTRGLFIGWTRALLVASVAPLGAWTLIVLELTALEPWLVALAQQKRDAVLDSQTALTAAALVFVFALAQAAFLGLAAIIGGGFKLPSASLSVRGATSTAVNIEPSHYPTQSRPQALAQRLQRSATTAAFDEAAAVEIGGRRTAFAGVGRQAQLPGPHLGDSYRRPTVRNRAAGGAP